MKFKLRCDFVLTGKVKKEDISSLMGEARELLKKGAPEGKGAVIESFSLKDNKIHLTIGSGTHVRPHDAIFRIKNHLIKELGKKHKLGVKEIKGTKYDIDFELEHKPLNKVTIPFAKEVKIEGKRCHLSLVDLSEDFLRKNYIDRMVSLIREKAKAQHYSREEHHTVVYEGKKKGIYYNEDPSKELLRRNWIRRTPHRNQFVFGPQITELSEAIKRAMFDLVYKPLGFVQMILPKIVSWDTWKRSGHVFGLYYGGFNPYLFSTPKSASPENWEDIADVIKITGEVPKEEIAKKLDPPAGGLAFAQCPPFWIYLEGQTIANESLPIKIFDWSGPTYRYEAGGAHGFERVDELHRIETLWLGTKEQVIELTEQVRKNLRLFMEDILELEMREAWVMPWFMEQKGAREMIDEEKMIVGTIDLEAYLPYSKKWLEVQNCSNNGDSYPKNFNVKGQKEELWSGCAGGSFERYLSAFLAQKGFDEKNWPRKFKKYITEIPEEIRFL